MIILLNLFFLSSIFWNTNSLKLKDKTNTSNILINNSWQEHYFFDIYVSIEKVGTEGAHTRISKKEFLDLYKNQKDNVFYWITIRDFSLKRLWTNPINGGYFAQKPYGEKADYNYVKNPKKIMINLWVLLIISQHEKNIIKIIIDF